MGSLMAGWDSRVTNPGEVTLQRNKSLTKEEIEAFWKSKKILQDEHLKAILSSSANTHQENKTGNFQRSSTMPADDSTRKSFMDLEFDTNLEKLKKNGWWTRSNWAFLNEPPVLERAASSYVSQFHVANMAASKLGHGGISA